MTKTAYFDNAATTFPKPECVYQAMDTFYRQAGGSAGRGNYQGATVAGKLLQDVRRGLQHLFHTNVHEAVFTSSATEALNLVLQGIKFQPGGAVYTSPFEHNAVTRTLHYLGTKIFLDIEKLRVERSTLQYDLEGICSQFRQNPPKLVVISHASNVCGVVAPVKEIFSLAKEYSAITVLDMAQTAGLIDLDLVTANVDFAVFAGHKTIMGPFGAAGLMLRQGIKLSPLIYGGTGMDSANADMPGSAPLRYEAGSRNIYALAGLKAALNWLAEQGGKRVYQMEEENKEKLLSLLNQYEFVKVIAATEQIGVISTIFQGLSSDEVGKVLAEQGVAVRTGLQCAPEAHRFLGTFPAGTVRFSVSCMTDEEDFMILGKALDYLVDNI